MKKYDSCTADIGEWCSKHQCRHKKREVHIEDFEHDILPHAKAWGFPIVKK